MARCPRTDKSTNFTSYFFLCFLGEARLLPILPLDNLASVRLSVSHLRERETRKGNGNNFFLLFFLQKRLFLTLHFQLAENWILARAQNEECIVIAWENKLGRTPQLRQIVALTWGSCFQAHVPRPLLNQNPPASVFFLTSLLEYNCFTMVC